MSDSATPWTVAHKAPLSMGFSRQEYWSGVPFPSPGDLPDPGFEPRSPASQADLLPSEPPGKSCKGLLLWVQNLAPLKLVPDNSSRLDTRGGAQDGGVYSILYQSTHN